MFFFREGRDAVKKSLLSMAVNLVSEPKRNSNDLLNIKWFNVFMEFIFQLGVPFLQNVENEVLIIS